MVNSLLIIDIILSIRRSHITQEIQVDYTIVLEARRQFTQNANSSWTICIRTTSSFTAFSVTAVKIFLTNIPANKSAKLERHS